MVIGGLHLKVRKGVVVCPAVRDERDIEFGSPGRHVQLVGLYRGGRVVKRYRSFFLFLYASKISVAFFKSAGFWNEFSDVG